jgi:hypothetical protein
MTMAELVRKLLEAIEAGDKPGAVAIAVQAVEEAANPPPRRHRKKEAGPRGEVVSLERQGIAHETSSRPG